MASISRFNLVIGSGVAQDPRDGSGGANGLFGGFGGAGAGKLPIPQGFYTDMELYLMLKYAEGDVALMWVKSRFDHTRVPQAGINGWDFPGGVHSKFIAEAIGYGHVDDIKQIDPSIELTNGGRSASAKERVGGCTWGVQTTPLSGSAPYWKALIPYYRDAMIWAWNQPKIQAVTDRAERLARMHSINWWGYHYLQGFGGGDGWKHRLAAARKACGQS